MNAYRTQEGRWIFDLGQNFAGKVRLTAYGPAGSEIVLRYCEDLTGDGQHVEQKHISGFVRTGEFQTDKYIKRATGRRNGRRSSYITAFAMWRPRGCRKSCRDRASWAL